MIFSIFAVFATLLVVALFVDRLVVRRIRVKRLEEKALLITGCDSGPFKKFCFGFDLALKCLSSGISVFASCRTQKGMDALQSKAGMTDRLFAFMMDVTSDASVQKGFAFVRKMLKESQKDLHALVSNAGILGNSAFDDFLRVNDYKQVAEVNTFGAIRVIHSFKVLLKSSRGRIVGITSSCCRGHIPGTGPYSVSKHAIQGYLEVLSENNRQEMRLFDVDVIIVEPGFFRTSLVNAETIETTMASLWERTNQTTRLQYGEHFFKKCDPILCGYYVTVIGIFVGTETAVKLLSTTSSPHTEWVVNAYYHAVTARFPQRRYQVGYDSLLVFVPFSFLPPILQDATVWFIRFIMRLPRPAIMENFNRSACVPDDNGIELNPTT
ncbi:unnamed protein product [Toxocara canis]|uniref:Estradiol 17-beta-dehydrogenase 2 n=1 Tax=Toxocara canis TaxID=6265 RepID=A0A183UBK2_TOXCA|nr:unnamed protein product [Toxocara canis]